MFFIFFFSFWRCEFIRFVLGMGQLVLQVLNFLPSLSRILYPLCFFYDEKLNGGCVVMVLDCQTRDF